MCFIWRDLIVEQYKTWCIKNKNAVTRRQVSYIFIKWCCYEVMISPYDMKYQL
jgi:hypothetical protein